MRILSGIQSSGKQHIGNYYGALRQFVDLQNRGDEALYFIANLHALTTVRDAGAAAALTRETAMAFLALGLDPERAILFRQSDIPEVTELYWILGTVVPLSNLDRAHSYKDKLARGIPADFGLFGQLTQLTAFDPTPAAIALATAPRVIAWVDVVEDLSGLEPDDGQWMTRDAVSDTFRALLAEIGRVYAPFLLANAAALARGEVA